MKKIDIKKIKIVKVVPPPPKTSFSGGKRTGCK